MTTINRGRIIALRGLSSSGKSTVADIIRTQMSSNGAQLSLGDPGRELGRYVFPFSYEQMYGTSARRDEPVDVDALWGWSLSSTQDRYIRNTWAPKILGTFKDDSIVGDFTNLVADQLIRPWLEKARKNGTTSARAFLDTVLEGVRKTWKPCPWAPYALRKAQDLARIKDVVVISDLRTYEDALLLSYSGVEIWHVKNPGRTRNFLSTAGLENAGPNSDYFRDGWEDIDTLEVLNDGNLTDLEWRIAQAYTEMARKEQELRLAALLNAPRPDFAKGYPDA